MFGISKKNKVYSRFSAEDTEGVDVKGVFKSAEVKNIFSTYFAKLRNMFAVLFHRFAFFFRTFLGTSSAFNVFLELLLFLPKFYRSSAPPKNPL